MHALEIRDLNEVGDLVMVQALVDEFDDGRLIRLLDSVREHLDEQPVWQAIGSLADFLCRQQNIAGREAVAIIHKHGLTSIQK